MGKDKSGTFHPGKGKPSGANKEEGLGLGPTDPDKMDEYMEISDKYTDGNEHLEGVHIRHANRNTSKGEDSYKAKENSAESDNAINEASNDGVNATAESAVIAMEQLPSVLTKDLFAEIATYRASPCISIYIPTHSSGMAINGGFDAISFKNELQDVTEILSAKGVSGAVIDHLLKPAFELMRDEKFWVSLSQGLAVYIASGYFRFIKMPVAPERQVLCNSSFSISQLIPIMFSSEYFYLLVVSKQKAKLFRGDKFGLDFIPVDGLPESISDVTGVAEKNSSTWRTGSHGGNGGANFHGMGGELDHKTDIASYLEAVDDVLYKKIFNKENAPLLLAGVEYLLPIYRSVCDYHNVYPAVLTGSHENYSTAMLHDEAMKIMAPFFERHKNRAKEVFADNIATTLTASLNEQVIPASYYAKISYLFVRRGAQLLGRFDAMKNELKLHEVEKPDSENLIDRAVEKTLLNGGEVFLVEAAEMPSEGELAAVLRYR